MRAVKTLLLFLFFGLMVTVAATRSQASTIQLAKTTDQVNDNAGSINVTVTVTRDSDVNEVLQVDYKTQDGSAQAPGDYTQSTGTLTFTKGINAQTVAIPIVAQEDADDATNSSGAETFSFQLSNPQSNRTAATISGSNTETITIIDVNGTRVGFVSSVYQVSEPTNGGASVVRLVVKRVGDNSQPETITYQTADGSAKAGTDYFSQSGTLNFPNTSPDKSGEDASTQFIDITVLSDNAANGNKTFSVTLSRTSGPTPLGISTATVTIIDSATSTVQFSSPSYTFSETSGVATITLIRSGNLNITGAVNVLTSPGTAQPNKNYVTTNTSVTFNAGESSKTFNIPLINDNVVTGTLSFSVALNAIANSALLIGGTTNAQVSITDAAPSNTVEFTDAEYIFAQDAASAKITVRLNRASGSNDTVGVDYSTSPFAGGGQAAVAGQDYTPVSGRLTFRPGETIQTFSVPLIDNGQTGDTKKVGLNLTNPTSNVFLGAAASTLDIVNAHSAGTIQFSAAQYSVPESNGAVPLTVLLNRTGDTSRAVTVNYVTNPGSASTSRFVPGSGQLTFAAGSASATITVGILNDSVIEPPQTFTVTLFNPQNAVLGATSTATVTIEDDDGINTVAFDAPAYGAVETSGAVSVRVRASRGGDPNQLLTVDLTFGAAGDTAIYPDDYQLPDTTTITFPAGVNIQTVTIPITDNRSAQGLKVFTVGLTNPGQFTSVGVQSSARVSIFDNSGPNTVQLLTSTNRFREGEQAAIAVTVVRFGDFNVNGTRVNYTTEVRTGDTAQDGVNFTQTSGTVFFSPLVAKIGDATVVVDNESQHSIIIPIPNNTLIQGDVTFHVTLTSSDVAQLGSISTTQITITDDDLGNVVQFTSPTYSVSESGGNAILTVKLSPNGDASKASSVDYVASPITAFAGFDFSPVSGTLTFAPGETSKAILIPVFNDSIPEDSETFRVTLSNPSLGTIIGPQGNSIVTIVDDDAGNVRATIQFNSSAQTVNNSAGSVSIPVTLFRTSSDATYTVDFTSSNISAIAGTDYIGVAGTVTFGPGESNKTITVPLIPQGVGQATRQFRVTLSNPTGGADLGDINDIVISITNPDTSTKILNVSTRGPVEQGNDVMIAGFIIQGSATKQLVLRGRGPSLLQLGVSNPLSDPTLALMNANGDQLAFNDDFGTNSQSDQAVLTTYGFTPADSRESAIVATLGPGSYTAILRGKSNGTGIVEVYDLNSTAASSLVNISTRGKVETGDNGAMIAGFIIAAPSGQAGSATRIAVRASGPSLTNAGIADALADTTLDLYRGSQLILSNDNWKTNSTADQAELRDINLAPGNDKESAIITNLDPGSYSAVVRGKGNTTGVALVEVYRVSP